MSQYTASEFGDQSDAHSQVQARLKWGGSRESGSQSPALGITEIGTVDIASGSRRRRNNAAGSQISAEGSQEQYSMGGGFGGVARTTGGFGGAGGDILD